MGVDDHLKSVDEAYKIAISEVRSRLSDEAIVDILGRYVAGGLDRDEAMEALNIDYIGTLYEMVAVYKIERPEPDEAEMRRGIEVIRLMKAGEDVPVGLRQPTSWKKH